MKKKVILMVIITACMLLSSCGQKKDTQTGSLQGSEESSNDIPVMPEQDETDKADADIGETGIDTDETSTDPSEAGTDTGETSTDWDEESIEEWFAQTQEYEQHMAAERQKRRDAYIVILENMMLNHVFPDGSTVYVDAGTMSDNLFCLYDIDGDEREELFIRYTTTCMAGMSEWIYEYDLITGELKEEFRGFPYCHYYYNGMLWEGYSHNQGLGPDFWPFRLYMYSPEQEKYVNVGSVEAWQKEYYPKDWNGKEFPDEVDRDGDGMVYAISNEPYFPSMDYSADGEEYEEWFTSWIPEGTDEIDMLWRPICEEELEKFRG